VLSLAEPHLLIRLGCKCVLHKSCVQEIAEKAFLKHVGEASMLVNMFFLDAMRFAESGHIDVKGDLKCPSCQSSIDPNSQSVCAVNDCCSHFAVSQNKLEAAVAAFLRRSFKFLLSLCSYCICSC